jgi:hypothetical protein
MTTAPRPAVAPALALAVLLALALLAWWPLLQARPALADDYLFGPIAKGGVATYWHIYGIWRIAGHPVPFWVRDLVPHGDRALALLTHLSAVALFYRLLRRLVSSEPLQLAAALVFATMPFGFQALTWNSALTFALSTIWTLAALFVTLRPVNTPGAGVKVGLAAAALSFLALSANEASLVLVAWVALYQVARGGFGKAGRPRWIMAALILLFEGAWVVLHLATRGSWFMKRVSFNPASLVSGLFYQWRQVTYFVHLPRLGSWLTLGAWLSAVAAAGVALLLWRAGRGAADGREGLGVSPTGPSIRLAFALLPIAAVAVYALGGGFSLDARKAYSIWAFLLIAGAWFMAAASARAQRAALWIAIALCPLLVLCSQATTRVWLQTAGIFERANHVIVDQALEGPYRFHWQPDAYTAWADFELLSGFRFDTPWLLAYAVGESAIMEGPPHTTLTWQPAEGTWRISRE